MQSLLDRLGRQVDTDAYSIGGGLAAGMIVNLHDDVRLRGETNADTVRQAMGLQARGPEAQFVGFGTQGPACAE